MAKRKPGKPADNVDRHLKPKIVFHLGEDLRAALLAATVVNRRTITSEIILALEFYLEHHGFWPLPGTKKT